MVQGLGDKHVDIKQKSHDVEGDNLLSLASHELRTPLSVVKWYTEMLLDGDCGVLNDDQTKYLKTIEKSNQRAIDLIKSLLNVSRLDLGTFSINPTDTDLRFLVKQVVTEYKSNIEGKKLHIQEMYESAIPGMIPNISVDKQICLVLMRNLISNAIIFSKEEGVININIKEFKQNEECGNKNLKDDSLVFFISDNGIGIPEEDKDKIFSKLFKASNVSNNDESKGSGLNLYITKEIMGKVGGDIWFTSTKDVGSTFYVLFPKHGMPKKEGRTTLD